MRVPNQDVVEDLYHQLIAAIEQETMKNTMRNISFLLEEYYEEPKKRQNTRIKAKKA